MKRGQVDAPIELFVAVIVLTASMSLAFYLMQQTDQGKCVATLKTETEKLQAAMLDIALASPPTYRTVSFEMPRCGDVNVQVLQFVYYSEPQDCRLCPAHYGGCWQIVPVSVNAQGQYAVVVDAVSCVQMSGDIWLTSTGCEDSIDLGEAPCPPGTIGCTAETTGIPERVWNGNPQDSPSRWLTLGKQEGSRVYTITLTKTAPIQSEGGEAGGIRVCVNPANQA
ncbi:MAG: hypothetical protein WC607_03590 [Candidatus Micrarchaeia archaeon]